MVQKCSVFYTQHHNPLLCEAPSFTAAHTCRLSDTSKTATVLQKRGIIWNNVTFPVKKYAMICFKSVHNPLTRNAKAWVAIGLHCIIGLHHWIAQIDKANQIPRNVIKHKVLLYLHLIHHNCYISLYRSKRSVLRSEAFDILLVDASFQLKIVIIVPKNSVTGENKGTAVS